MCKFVGRPSGMCRAWRRTPGGRNWQTWRRILDSKLDWTRCALKSSTPPGGRRIAPRIPPDQSLELGVPHWDLQVVMSAPRGDLDSSPIVPINLAGRSTSNNRAIEGKQVCRFRLQEYCDIHLACKNPKMLIGPLRAANSVENKQFLMFPEPETDQPYKH